MLKKMIEELNGLKIDSTNKYNNKLSEVIKEYEKVFKDSSALSKDLKNAESASEFGSDDFGYYVWYRLTYQLPSFSNESDYCIEAFESYVSNYGFLYDRENHCLKLYQGECIVINEDGDVFLSDGYSPSKEIISSDKYKNRKYPEAIRNKLIESWMNKNGYFPSVLRETRYGDLFVVNTQKKN